MDVTADYFALRREAGAVWLPRDVLRVAGPDALSFLQGQLSQDLHSQRPATSVWSLLLQPQGKVDALLRVTQVGPDDYVLDTDAGWGERVAMRLQRFKLRVKADIEPLTWRCLALRGPKLGELGDSLQGAIRAAAWPVGPPGVDLLGEQPPVPQGVHVCGLEAWEAVRVESGFPSMGRELDERTIPEEAGVVAHTVSFTKGCYVGQELVARIDSRGGNVPRRLRGVVVASNVIPPVGATVGVDGKEVGALTSVAESLERRAPVALAYVRREVEPPVEASLSWDGRNVPARVEALPLVP